MNEVGFLLMICRRICLFLLDCKYQMNGANHNGGRIARNTLILYVRMLFLLFVGLYTSRVVLAALGADDFGIYGVVGGVVAMFTIISGSLSAAITRFIAFEMGKGEKGRLATVFSSAVTIQFIIAALVLVVAEPTGIWFIENRMNIPADRLYAAHWVYQFSLLTFLINIISVPYNASIIAHEKMSAFAVIGIFEGLAKLAVAFLIMCSPIDRLIYYSALMCLVAVAVRLAYTGYCRKHFEECRFRFIWDKESIRQMFSFAGWNFIGVASGALRDHGGNILINIFSGPIANAARAVSVQLGGAVQSFVTNFMTAVNPQITKSYAAEDRDYTMQLVFRSSRYSFFLLLLIALPVLLNPSFLLDLWLEDVPMHSAAFVCLALLFSLSESISNPLITLMLATGNIRRYQIIVGGLQLMNLPVAYLVLKAGAPPQSILIVSIVISQICLFVRLALLRGMAGLPALRFIREVYLRVIAVFLLAFPLEWWLSSMLGEGLAAFLASCMLSLVITAVIIWTIGVSKDERAFFKAKIRSFIGRKGL